MKIIIIGGGDVGFNLAKILSKENHDIVMIDSNPEKCAYAQDKLDISVLQGNGSSGSLLASTGIGEADMVVAATDIDEVNLMASMHARKLSKARIVARVRDPEYSSEKAVISGKDLGIDLMIHPEQEVANEIVRLVKQSSATECMTFADGRLQLLGIRLTSRTAPAVGKTLLELGAGYAQVNFRVVAITRQNQTIIPRGDDWIHFNDQLYIITDNETLPEVMNLMGKEDEKLENIMILGGGKIGRLVAAQLENEVGIKLIETNKDKSIKIAEHLKKTLVISGDGTDIDLLAREDVMNMDSYIALSNQDENNIISCLLAKHLGVNRVIGLVNKLVYLPIIPTIGIDSAVSKVLSTVDGILRFIRRGKVLSVSSFKRVGAEVIEFVIPEGAPITKKSLKNMKFPQGAIVGGIMRGSEVMIPTGETCISPNDKVIVFALPEAIGEIEKIVG
ncbi:Trk system potassium transporter TrkA [candidate division KSB1 bacterium]